MPSPTYVPRFTLILLGGVVLFFAVSLLYSLPVLQQPIPIDAPPDYLTQRVREHMVGKTIPFFMASLLITALVVARPWKK